MFGQANLNSTLTYHYLQTVMLSSKLCCSMEEVVVSQESLAGWISSPEILRHNSHIQTQHLSVDEWELYRDSNFKSLVICSSWQPPYFVLSTMCLAASQREGVGRTKATHTVSLNFLVPCGFEQE